MGLYLRKSFRAGPIRFNLSKSGIGVSAGVKGARIGTGPRGAYVHAGRYGLYYRQQLSSGRSGRKTNTDGGSFTMFLVIVAVGFGIWVFKRLIENPIVLVVTIAVAMAIPLIWWSIQVYSKKLVSEYKKALDNTFVANRSPLSPDMISALKQQRQRLPNTETSKREIEGIEANVYQAVLDKILDSSFITEEEAASIVALEQTLNLNPETRLQTKKEIFSAAYVEAIQDREITNDEMNKLKNLMVGLAIPQTEVQHELGIVQEIVDSQTLCLPLKAIPSEELDVQIQKSEQAFYKCSAQVLSKRKSKDSSSGYEYTVKRDGTLVLTNKRVFVVGNGTTSIGYEDIVDLDVDIDKGLIEIAKSDSGRPIILKMATPIYTGRAINLLMNATQSDT